MCPTITFFTYWLQEMSWRNTTLYIKILHVCVCVRVCDRSGRSVGRLGKCDLHTYYTLYCVCMITSGCNRGAAAEKRTQSGSRSWSGYNRGAAAEANTIGEQQIISDRCQLASCTFTPWQTPIGITAMVKLYYIPRLIAGAHNPRRSVQLA